MDGAKNIVLVEFRWLEEKLELLHRFGILLDDLVQRGVHITCTCREPRESPVVGELGLRIRLIKERRATGKPFELKIIVIVGINMTVVHGGGMGRMRVDISLLTRK
jgi:hypothetical protein